MFTAFKDIPERLLFGGTICGRYAHGDRMTIGDIRLDANTTVPMHEHPHEQITCVIEGRFEFTIGEETTVLEPGSVALIPGGVPHGGRTLTQCWVIDVFAPVREDYR
jgi:quercetin dioxygenase-like cupin family protein